MNVEDDSLQAPQKSDLSDAAAPQCKESVLRPAWSFLWCTECDVGLIQDIQGIQDSQFGHSTMEYIWYIYIYHINLIYILLNNIEYIKV
jgi:hypothetical protein